MAADQGSLVFTDDFHPMTPGWVTGTPMSGETIQYGPDGYAITTVGNYDFWSISPYLEPLAQLTMSVTATASDSAPAGAGFGVECSRGSDASEVSYEFLAISYSQWVIQKRTSQPYPVALQQGSIPANPGSTPLTVEGICDTLDDGRTTRLIAFVNGQMIGDLRDTTADLPIAGWTGGIEAQGAETQETITVTKFEERDFSH